MVLTARSYAQELTHALAPIRNSYKIIETTIVRLRSSVGRLRKTRSASVR